MSRWSVRCLDAAGEAQLARTVWAPKSLRDQHDRHEDEGIWLLLERVDRGGSQPLACLRWLPSIGSRAPRYWYHVGCVVHAAAELGLYHRERTLLLGNDYTGASEFADITVDPGCDPVIRDWLLRQLLRAAILLMRERARALAANLLLVEVPGLQDADGHSVFWDGLGRHFYPGSPRAAQERFGRHWVTLVAALLPRLPLIVSILRESTQQAIGVADPSALPLKAALQDIGLVARAHVRVQDAGPVCVGHWSNLPPVTAIRHGRLQVGPLPAGLARSWICARGESAQRACLGPLLREGEHACVLDLDTARVLGAPDGQELAVLTERDSA